MSSLDPFESILKSMGVDKFDPLVLSALQEYSRRLGGDLLCDARDYANHRGAADIDANDIKLAVQLNKACKSRVHPAMNFVEEIGREINKLPLAQLIDEKQYAARYPQVRDPFNGEGPDPVTGLLQRTYTLVPANSTGTSAKSAGHASAAELAFSAAATATASTGAPNSVASIPAHPGTGVFQQVNMPLLAPQTAEVRLAPVASAFK